MKKDRKRTIIITSFINILTNIVLSTSKVLIGLITNSISILSDGINNLSDALSSIITIIGTKLAAKEPDKEHPYGHGRIEYITSLIVSIIVLYAGIEAFIESIKKIINPELPTYTYITLIIIGSSIIVKMILSKFITKKGIEAHSQTLEACGADAFNDVLLTSSVLIGSLLYIIFNINIEAYIGILISIYIIKSGIDFIKESINHVLGYRVDGKLTTAIKKEVEKEKEVEGAYDLHLTNYGPENYLGSIHIELVDTLTVAEVDKISRRITKNIYDKYGVLLHTIGVYSVNTNNTVYNKAKDKIKKTVFKYEGILELHGLYIDKENKTIYLDIVLDFNVNDKQQLYKDLYKDIKELYKDYTISITLDYDICD